MIKMIKHLLLHVHCTEILPEFEFEGQQSKVKVTRDKKRKTVESSPLTMYCNAFNISGTAERICAKFTRKTCLVPHSDEF